VVGGTTPLTSLNVSGTSALNGTAVTTTAAQTFTGATTLGTDNTLTGTLMTFGSTVTGANTNNLTLSSSYFDSTGQTVAFRFGGNVTLGSLTINSGSAGSNANVSAATVTFSQAAVNPADGKLTNFTGDTTATTFTITAPNGFVMGAKDRLVSLGNLTIDCQPTLANNSNATLGWITVYGNFLVKAASVTLIRGTQIFASDSIHFRDRLNNPLGGSQITDSTDPSRLSFAPAKFVINTSNQAQTDDAIRPRLLAADPGLRNSNYSEPTGAPNTKRFTNVFAYGEAGIGGPGSPTVYTPATVGALTNEQAARVEVKSVAGELALSDLLEKLELTSRSATTEELISFLSGVNYYQDLPNRVPASTDSGDYRVLRDRLRPSTVVDAIAAYNAFTGEDKARLSETGAILSAALKQFMMSNPSGSAKQFADYLAKSDIDTTAANRLNELTTLMAKFDLMGLSPFETMIIKRSLINSISSDEELKARLDSLYNVNRQSAN